MTWPAIFPQTSGAFSGKSEENAVRLIMESGRARQRRQFTAPIRIFSAEWDMSDFQFGMFQAFVKHKLNNGADWFDVSLPSGAAFVTFEARIIRGEYNGAYVDKFTNGVYRWRVNASLEVIG